MENKSYMHASVLVAMESFDACVAKPLGACNVANGFPLHK